MNRYWKARARYWRDQLFAEHRTGQASKVITPFDLKPGQPVYLVPRKSGRERVSNLVNQIANLRKIVADAEAVEVGILKSQQANGTIREGIQISGFNPYWLRQAAREAQEVGASVMLAETTDRFIRNRHFLAGRRHWQDYQATDEQLEELANCVGGMPLMTHLDPDAPPADVRRYQAKRGQRLKRHKGGRPENRTAGYKKRIREGKSERAVRLKHRFGKSIRKISRILGVPKSTVDEWIQKAQ